MDINFKYIGGILQAFADAELIYLENDIDNFGKATINNTNPMIIEHNNSNMLKIGKVINGASGTITF